MPDRSPIVTVILRTAAQQRALRRKVILTSVVGASALIAAILAPSPLPFFLH